jgi:hypothetical protein
MELRGQGRSKMEFWNEAPEERSDFGSKGFCNTPNPFPPTTFH